MVLESVPVFILSNSLIADIQCKNSGRAAAGAQHVDRDRAACSFPDRQLSYRKLDCIAHRDREGRVRHGNSETAFGPPVFILKGLAGQSAAAVESSPSVERGWLEVIAD